MRKGRLLIAIALALVLLGSLAVACTQPAPAPAPQPATPAPTPTPAPAPVTPKTYDWKFAGWGPPSDVMEQTGELWGNEVMKLSNGRIKISYYHGQALGKQLDQPAMLTGGVCDISELPSLPMFPLMEISEQPFVATNRVVGIDAYYNVYTQGLFDKELAPFKILVFMTTDPTFLMTRGKAVATVDDLKGLKIRGRPGAIADTAAALGATAVAMPASDLYMSLSTGILDGTLSTPEYVLNNKISEVAKYAVWEPLSTGVMPLAMTMNLYNSLPDDLKLIINQAAAKTRYDFINKFVYTDAQNIDRLKKGGFEVSTLSDAQKAVFRQKAQPLVDKWLKAMQDQGLGTQAQQVLDTFQRASDLAK